MPIETVVISYHQPGPNEPVQEWADPIIREYTTETEKVVMMHITKPVATMTEADLDRYKAWIGRLPDIMRANRYHHNFIAAFCVQANKIVGMVQTRLNAADLHTYP
jgi:hypothetical protein